MEGNETREAAETPDSARAMPWGNAWPAILALALVAGAGLVAACGGAGGTARAVQAGDVSVPGTATPKPTPVLGSMEGSEIMGVQARYQTPVGMDLTLNVQIMNVQKKTATSVMIRSVGGTFAPQEFRAVYNTALARLSLQGAIEGIHTGEVLAVFADGSQGQTVLFEVQVGDSTAVAVPSNGVSQASGAGGGAGTGTGSNPGAGPNPAGSSQGTGGTAGGSGGTGNTPGF